MREDWKLTRLGDICFIRRGSSPRPIKNYLIQEGGMPWVKISDATEANGKYINSTAEQIKMEGVSRSVIVNPGDLILSNSGTAGLPMFMGITACIHDGWQTFRDFNGIDKEYLYYFLLFIRHRLLHNAYDSVMKNLTLDMLRDYEMYLPPMEEQKRIVDLLGTIDKKIEINNKINRNLSDQVQALFKEWFIDSPDSSSWPVGTFSDLIISTLGGDWGKEEETGNYTEQVYCVRGADIPEVKAGNKGKMPTRFILPKNFASKQLVAGDIIVEISGGSPTQSTGRVASVSQSLLDRYDKGMVCTNFCRALKPKNGYSMFVYYYWQYLYDRGIFFLYENGTTGIKNLDIKGFLENEEIVLPPMELINRFDDLCQSIFNQIFKNGISTEKLAETRDALLPRLMSGELDVSALEF